MAALKVLFPLDGSEPTYEAVEKGIKILGAAPGFEATFLVVISKALRDMPADAREYLEFDDEDELFIRDDEAKAVIDKATAIAKRLKVTKVKGRTPVGNVKEAILAAAAEHDVMVMHGLRASLREDEQHGNMVEILARAVKCSVLLIRT